MANTKIPSELVAINAISGTLIADNAITSVHIAENNITATQIAINAVTALQMADGTITSAKISDGTIVTADIADGQISTAKLVDSSVTQAKIGSGAVVASSIANGTITSTQMAANSISTANVQDNAINLDKMASLSRGSIIYGNSAGNPAYLAAGTNGHVLTSDGTDISWTADTDLFLASSGGTVSGDIIISASTDTPLIITTTNSNGPHMRFQVDGNNKHFIGSGTGIGGMGDADDLALRAYDNIFLGTGNSSTKQVSITSTGDVKVGALATSSATTAPLVVAKASTDVQAIFGDNNSSIDDPSIRIIGRNTANNAIRYTFLGLDADTNHGYLGYNAGAGGFVNALNFDTSGNVGIGDNAPQDFLEVKSTSLGGITISNSNHNQAALSFARSSTATARIFTTEPDATHTGQFNFQTSNASGGSPNLVTAMVIDDHQNVGIGTTSPAATLEVGTLTSGSTGNVIINSEGGNPPALQVKSRTNRARINVQDNDTSGYIIAEGSVFSFGFADAVSDNNININTSHNVGIGTDTPITKLHIQNNTSTVYDATGYQHDLFIEKRNTAGNNQVSSIRFGVTGHDGSTTAEASIGVLQTSNAHSGNLVFGTRHSGTRAERMRITSDGNVGIGTANPSDRLVVQKDSANIEPILVLKNDNTTDDNGISIDFSGKDTGGNNILYGRIATKYTNHATEKSHMIFTHRNNSGTFSEWMRVTHDALVGIGEDSPDRQLHVKSGTTNVVAKFESTDTIAGIEFTDSGGSAEIGCDGSDVVLFPAGTEKFRVQNSTGYLVAQSASQVRLVLGSTGNSSNNTSNWIRGTGSELGLNSGGGNIGMEINGNLKLQVNTTGQVLANPLGVTVPTFSFIGDTNTGMTRPTGDTLQFVTGGSARWRINSSGHLVPENQHTYDIGGTNAEVRNVYAQGISFASNANASGTTSEILDDYEEGTYTATITCASGSISLNTSFDELSYVKIGKLVHVQGRLACNGVSNPTGATNLNLPFTSLNDTNKSGMADNITSGYFNGSAVTNGIYTIYGNIDESSANNRLFVMVIPASHNLGDNYMASGSDLFINFTYTAA